MCRLSSVRCFLWLLAGATAEDQYSGRSCMPQHCRGNVEDALARPAIICIGEGLLAHTPQVAPPAVQGQCGGCLPTHL